MKMSDKGQLNMEYFVVMLLFLSLSLYFAFQLLEFYPRYLDYVEKEILRSDAYRLSEMLINDDGEPISWHVAGPTTRVGLSYEFENKPNLVSLPKVAQLNALCAADYDNVKDLVGSKYDFNIDIQGTTGVPSVQCGVQPASESVATIVRVVAFEDGSYGKVTVNMWGVR